MKHHGNNENCEKPKRMIWPFSTIYNKVVSVFRLLKDIKELVIEAQEIARQHRNEERRQFERVNRKLADIQSEIANIGLGQSQIDQLAAAVGENKDKLQGVLGDGTEPTTPE